ncbi:MAG TPA: hypothetical protein VG738_03910 [Chitinophagaceae bacterium]|nr:hypothetical protein [Chitinophagaceae bacterium]
MYEIHHLKVQSAYIEEEEKIMAEFEDIKINLYEQVQLMQPDNTVGDNVKESIRWFHTVATLLEEGYKNDKWKKFISFTRGFVFNEPGYAHLTHDNVLLFDWPKDENLQPADIVYKVEMRHEVDKLIKLQADADKLKEDKPNNKPEFFVRYIFIFYFTVALALKLLRTYAEYLK